MNVCATRAIVNDHPFGIFEVDVPRKNCAVNRGAGIAHGDLDSALGVDEFAQGGAGLRLPRLWPRD